MQTSKNIKNLTAIFCTEMIFALQTSLSLAVHSFLLLEENNATAAF